MCCCYIECKKAKAISISCLIILVIGIILFATIGGGGPQREKNILVATAVSRR